MKFITKIGVACATIAMMASTMSYAGTVVTSQLDDHYIGADGSDVSTTDYSPNNIAAHYDTHWMKVSKTITDNNGSLSGELKVEINSNFVAYNTQDTIYSFGDLFIMDANDSFDSSGTKIADGYKKADSCVVDGAIAYGCNEYSEIVGSGSTTNTKKSPNKWQYAFDLGVDRVDSYADNTNKGGILRELYEDDEYYDYSLRSTKSNREWQAITVKDRNSNAVNNNQGGTWNTNVSDKLLTMTFDITGTSLMGAAQLALRWQMTCANDIIEVVTNFGSGGTGTGTTPVPEPSSFMLMLLAGLGLFASRKKKAIKFQA